MADRTLIYVVDDDEAVRDSLEALLLAEGFDVACFASAEAFLTRGDMPAGRLLPDGRAHAGQGRPDPPRRAR